MAIYMGFTVILMTKFDLEITIGAVAGLGPRGID